MSKPIRVGDRVRVLPPYTGNGTYGHDGATGERYVTKVYEPIAGFPWFEYRIARHPDGPWEFVVHACRVEALEES